MTKLLKVAGLQAIDPFDARRRGIALARVIGAAVAAMMLGACSSGGPLLPVQAAASLAEPTGSIAPPSGAVAKSAGGAVVQSDPWEAVVAAAIEENALGNGPKAGPIRERPVGLASLDSVIPKGGGYKKIGKPYSVKGVMYVPKHQPDYEESGIASWYGDDFHGKKTANGEVYDMQALTAAHRTLPLPSLVSVTNVRNGKTVIVRINDRGPFKKGRIIDVSARAAKELGFDGHGLTEVRVKYLGPAPIDGDDAREKAHLASLAR